MGKINPEGGLAAARRKLAEIWADPQMMAIALRHADHPASAEDAMQITYLAMLGLPHLDQIENMPGYFCRVLIRAVYREQGQLGALLVEDVARVTEASGAGAGAGALRVPPAGFEDGACAAIQAQDWHRRLIRDRAELMAAVPSRSGDPARYRSVIWAAAEQILRAGIDGEPSEPDSIDALRASYPEYFDAPGIVKNTSYQRLSRARADVRRLLQTVVGEPGPPVP